MRSERETGDLRCRFLVLAVRPRLHSHQLEIGHPNDPAGVAVASAAFSDSMRKGGRISKIVEMPSTDYSALVPSASADERESAF